jgi:hypothetical protein
MNRVILGRSGLEVTPIAYGTWQFGGDWGDVDEEQAIRAVRQALDLGINLFDTAQAYGFGVSERILGRALADELRSRREDLVIATKGGQSMEGGRIHRDSSPAFLRRGVEESLVNLGIDVIDLYQVHWPDPSTPFSETAAALGAMVDEGKIRHIGVSNFDAAQMAEFSRTRPVETLQPPYHLFDRGIERDVLPYCREHDIGVLAYGPLAHGLLGGRMTEDTTFPENDWRRNSPLSRSEVLRRDVAIVRELGHFAAERNATVSQLAIAWVLANPAVDVAIVGARQPDHLKESVGAAELKLDADDLAQIDRIMEGAVEVAVPPPPSA